MAHPTFRRTMTPLAGALALALAFGGISAITAPAATAAAAPAFDCTEPRFFAQAENPVGTLQLSTGSYNSQGNSVWTELGSSQTGANIYNALAFNSADEYLYGTRYGSGTGVAGSFVRIDRSGDITHLGVSAPALGSASSTLWDSGEFDVAGNYYVASGNSGTSSIRKISGLKDVTSASSTPRPAMTTVTLSSSARFADFTFKNGFLWAPNYGQSSTIYRIDVNGLLGTAGAVSSFVVPAEVMPPNSYGSAFTMTNGNLAFIGTDGNMYQISVTDPTTASPTFNLVSKVGAPNNARSDATNCATARTSSLSVAKTGPVKIGVGQAITWEVTVKNDGPGITSGFVLTDTLPAGLTNTTVTSADTSCVLNAAKTIATCNGGRLAVGATAKVTVTATAPMTPGPLANQAYAVGNEDPSPDAPTIANTQVELATKSDVPVSLPASGVVTSPTTSAEGGTVSYSGGVFTYTPPTGFSGNDTFVYTTSSGNVTVYVVVNPIAAAGKSTTTFVDVPVTIDPDTLLDDSVGTGLELTSVSGAVNGSVSIVNGSPVFVPTSGFSGNGSFTFTLTDDDGLTATETYAVRVRPTAGPVTATVATNSSVVVTTASLLAASAGTGLSISSVGTSIGGVLTSDTGGYRFTPTVGTSGSGAFSYTVTDAAGRTATDTVTITITPLAANDSRTTPAGTPVTVNVLTNDAGTGLEITDVSIPSSGSAAISAGQIVFTPATASFSGVATFTYEITDDAGRTATATVTVTVTPVAAPASKTTPVNTNLTVLASELVGAGTGTGLTVTSVGSATHGSVSLVSGNPVFVPTTGYSGDASFEYTVTDGEGSTSTATVSVTVTPTASNRTTTTQADTAVTVTGTTLVGAGTGTGLELTGVGGAVNGTVAIVGGNAVFTPTTGFSGSASYTFTLTDDDGGTATATVSVTVTPTAADRATSTPVNTPVTVTGATLIAAGTGTDLALTSVGGATNGTVAIVGGNAVFTPTTGFSGDASYTFTLTDDDGGTATATMAVTVTPLAANRTTSTPANTTVTVTAATLQAAGTGTGLELTGVGSPINGTVAIVSGNAVFTPTTDFSGTGTFTFTLTDDDGGTATATVTVTVTPRAVDDSITTPLNTAATLNVLTNDIGAGLTVTSHAAALHGAVTIAANGDLAYTPATKYSGLDTVTYSLSGAGGTDSATVSILVTPLAPDDAAVTDAGTAIDIDVLANDGGTGLVITGTGTPSARGTVTFTSTGVRYAPAAGYSGIETFTYTARDAAGSSVTATVTVSVRPLAAPSTAKGAAGRSFTIDVSGSGTGTGLVVTSVTPPKNGTAVINPDGTITFTPRAGFSGVEVITYTFTDSSGLTATGTVSVTVAAVSSVSALPFMGTEPGMLVALAGALLALGGLGLGARMIRRRVE